jgi:hypothetical protein
MLREDINLLSMFRQLKLTAGDINLQPATFSLHPVPCTLYLVSCTLYPVTCTLHLPRLSLQILFFVILLILSGENVIEPF